jgi:alpha-tubulin suppressor-like RCC1 family protein
MNQEITSMKLKLIPVVAVFVATIFSSKASAQLLPIPVTGPTSSHACSIVNGALICWGENTYGQVGDGTMTNAIFPVVVIPSGVVQAALGESHSCAIVAKGALQCWGNNGNFQVNGTGVGELLPVTVASAGVTSVAAGAAHTCAVIAGKVKCWGSDSDGQIGNGSASSEDVAGGYTIPTVGATRVFAGANHNCALYGTRLRCWGRNEEGQLGNGDEDEMEEDFGEYPAPIEIDASVTAVDLGKNHSCALAGGRFLCAGENTLGQLGNESNDNTSIPQEVLPKGVSAFKLGSDHTCALRYGSLKCWGSNDRGQIGSDPEDVESSNVPLTLIGLGVTNLAAGLNRTCIVRDGEQSCIGANEFGQLGDGSSDDSFTFVKTVLE